MPATTLLPVVATFLAMAVLVLATTANGVCGDVSTTGMSPFNYNGEPT